jgi:nucleoside-diphosphate-sugar epimerase
MMIVFVWFVV